LPTPARDQAQAGAALHIMGLSHLHMTQGRITAEWFLIDEVSICKQILAARAPA
jgi:hypothetical protein